MDRSSTIVWLSFFQATWPSSLAKVRPGIRFVEIVVDNVEVPFVLCFVVGERDTFLFPFLPGGVRLSPTRSGIWFCPLNLEDVELLYPSNNAR
jgi:hypothetical protein